MARPARIEYEGAFYHVMNWGKRRKAIFIDNHDRARFYEIIGNIESRYKIIIYLMSNHYHLIIETPLGNLSRAIQRLNGDYALYFSRRHNKRGQVCCWLYLLNNVIVFLCQDRLEYNIRAPGIML